MPAVSILIPTQGRRDYLAVALASLAPQLAAHAGDLIVVEDGARDAATEALVVAGGGRYLAHGAPRGPNAARNTAIAAAQSELLVFLDDDVEVWPGWLAALLAAAAGCPDHEAFGGPIRARLEGTNLQACGREPPPITTLDLGPQDTDAELVWSANLAVRSSALERIGSFDAGLGIYGDEEDWLRRLRAGGGRIRYVAGAGVDHRRTGADARLVGLIRAAYRRGRHGRRYDVHKGVAPALTTELRVFAGCLWHVGRRRCGNGFVMAAHTAGRIAEWIDDPKAPPATDVDFASGRSGNLSRRALAEGRVKDAVADLLTAPARRRIVAQAGPARRVLAVAVVRPELRATADRAAARLRGSRHHVDLRLVEPRPGLGKWQNLNAALAGETLSDVDWLLLFDDDVVLPRRFLDAFLTCAEHFGFVLAQPAHAFASHAAWPITRRRPGLLARRTRFVEIGPVTALRAPAVAELLPFPDLRMGWGLDNHWGAVAAQRGWPLGVVDATAIHHLRPVAITYDRAGAFADARAFLADRPYVTRDEAAQTLAAYERLSDAR
ncbi:MAG: glycosyltransferase [Solirubrobacteraceae bacterium]